MKTIYKVTTQEGCDFHRELYLINAFDEGEAYRIITGYCDDSLESISMEELSETEILELLRDLKPEETFYLFMRSILMLIPRIEPSDALIVEVELDDMKIQKVDKMKKKGFMNFNFIYL